MPSDKNPKIKIPTKCVECYGSDFKLPRPGCWYDKKLKEIDTYFTEELEMDLHLDIKNALKQLQPMSQECLKSLPSRAVEILKMRQLEGVQESILAMKTQIEELKNGYDQIFSQNDDATIFKEEKTINAPIQMVKKDTPIKIEFSEESKFKPVGGWKKYRRNIKKENIPAYLKKMKGAHPELKTNIELVENSKNSDCIKLTKNKAGNYMIEYRDIQCNS